MPVAEEAKYSADDPYLMPATGAFGSGSRRLARVAIFVAIVWGVAATFVGFEVISLRGMDFALSHPQWFGRLLLSSATQQSKACEVRPGERPGTSSTLSATDARVGAWMLGLRLGQDSQARQSRTVDPTVLASSAAGVRQVAALLAVPTPGLFEPHNIALANTEFLSVVEQDASETAHGLAVAYSPQACLSYKLGALWGYATLSRFALPGEPSIFAVEIRYYAPQIGLPEEVWRAMIERTPREATADQINAQSVRLTDAVTKHLNSPPASR